MLYVYVGTSRESKKRKVAGRDHGYTLARVHVVSLRLKLVQNWNARTISGNNSDVYNI